MTTDSRIPDAGLIWVRRGPTYVAIPDPDAGVTCHAQGCKQDRANGQRYCSDTCASADIAPAFNTCWRCCARIDGRGHYCSKECKDAIEASRVRIRDYSERDRKRNVQHNLGTCPTCHASPGRKCVSVNGNTIGRDHKARPTPKEG